MDQLPRTSPPRRLEPCLHQPSRLTRLRRLIGGVVGLVAAWLLVGGLASVALAQQSTIGTPGVGVGHGYYERIGVGFGLSGPGFFFNTPGAVAPPVGGGPTGGGGGVGFGFRRGGVSGSLGLGFDQGASSSFGSTTPMLTVPNGGGGGIFSGTQVPFVTGFTPVIGDGGVPTVAPVEASAADRIARYQMGERGTNSSASNPPAPTPRPGTVGSNSTPTQPGLSLRPETLRSGMGVAPPSGSDRIPVSGLSTADQGAASLEDLAAARAAQQQRLQDEAHTRIETLIARADAAEAEGRRAAAAAYLRQAAREATGADRIALENRVLVLRRPSAGGVPSVVGPMEE